jgi:hypothetical protein
MRLDLATAVVLIALASPAAAQNHDHAGHSEHAGKESREIKALDDAAVRDYLSGAGMGFALAAELNGYPGPRHVLELSRELDLTAEQRSATERIFARMQEAAVAAGEEVVELEKQLDARFAHRHIDEGVLTELVARIATLNGRLRAVHLQAHLETSALLSAAQIRRYNELRGYGS